MEAKKFLHTSHGASRPTGTGAMDNKVCFYSYNSRGFGTLKQDFMRFLLSDTATPNSLPILCNQENFILRDNSYKLRKAFPGYQLLINPAIKDQLSTGRPSNGMFIAFPDSIKNNVIDVSPGFWRVQAAKISFNSTNLLLINSYLPTDPQRNTVDETDLLETLGHIKKVVANNVCDDILWAGDLNSDFSRQSSHTIAVQDALQELGLQSSWELFQIDYTAAQEMLGRTFTSVLDHFAWTPMVGSSVVDAGVLHLPDNSSDHSPIYCTVNMSAINHTDTSPKAATPRPSWKRASPEQKLEFKADLTDKLARIYTPVSALSCQNVHCKDPKHREDLDSYTLEVLETVQAAAEETLPTPATSNRAGRFVRPGWLSEVKPFRDKAYFWHQVWKSAGKPLNTQLHTIMKRTRNLYHYQYKKCRKSEDRIRKNKLLSACLGEGGDLFKEIKALRKAPQTVASSIDGVSDTIPDHFGGIYSALYNSANDATELRSVTEKVESAVNSSQLESVLRITPEVVKKAAEKLKAGKSDPVYKFSSDCFKNADMDLFIHLSAILRCCTVHSHVSQVLLLSTLVPLVKDKLGDISTSKNYRSVAISSILLKLLDWVIILLEGDSLGLDELQFAYQAGCSTGMCTWAALETVDYFLKNGSEVFTCATDMSKAFDLTLHSLMFTKMLAAGLPAILVRLLVYIYSHQLANVRWNGEVSSTFTVRNGCGQGKVLAAIAYCLYCEELFKTLRRRQSGCWVMGRFRGIFGYSDDNWLLAPSLPALQDMLVTCQEYAASHNLKFSTDQDPRKCKTKCMAFLKKPRELPNMILCGNPLPWVEKLVHLGNIVGNKIDGGQLDLRQKAARYIDKNCNINQEFSFAHPSSRVLLNKIYNCHFSGYQIWDLFSQGAEKFYSTYNKSLKVMADLPLATHRYLLESLSEQQHMSTTVIRHYLKFISNIEKSNKPVLRQLLSIAKADVRTVTGSNLRNILLKTNLSTVDELHPGIAQQITYKQISERDLWRIPIIKELVDIKCGDKTQPDGWEIEELQQILDFVCTE